MKKLKKFFYAFIALSIFGLVSCRNTNDPDPEPVPIPPEPPKPKVLESIAFDSIPSRSFSTESTSSVLNFSGLIVNMVYDDGSTIPVNVSNLENSNPDEFTKWDVDFTEVKKYLKDGESPGAATDVRVNVYYQETEQKKLETHYLVNIVEPDKTLAKKIEIVSEPTKRSYKHYVDGVNDVDDEEKTLSKVGLIVNIFYEDSEGNPLPYSPVPRYVADADPAEWDFTELANGADDVALTQAITVTYKPDTTDNATWLSTEFNVTIEPQIIGFSVTHAPKKTVYLIGEELEIDELEVTLTWSHKSKEDEVLNDFTDKDAWEFYGYNPVEAGKDKVVEIRQKGTDNKAEFTVSTYLVEKLILPDALQSPKVTTFFNGEDTTFLRKDFLKDSNKIEIEAVLKDDGGNIIETLTPNPSIPVTDPRVSLRFSGNNYNAETEKFFLEATDPFGAAIVTIAFSPTPTIEKTEALALRIMRVFEFSNEISQADSEYVRSRFANGAEALLNITENIGNGSNETGKLFGQSGSESYTSLFVTYGYYPQTAKKATRDITGVSIPIEVFDDADTWPRKITRGGLDMYLGTDGYYYVCVDYVEWFQAYNPLPDDAQFTYRDNTKLKDVRAKKGYFEVEPIVWRVMDANYNNSSSVMMHSLLALDRVAFYDDDMFPYKADENGYAITDADGKGQNIKDQGGKKVRTVTIEGETKYIGFDNYTYSTLRAFLNGKYEPDDPLTYTPYYEYPRNLSNRGFRQTAFGGSDHLVEVDLSLEKSNGGALGVSLSSTVKDAVFVLSPAELTKKDVGYWFVDTSKITQQHQHQRRQVQLQKQLSDYALARGAKRWTVNTMTKIPNTNPEKHYDVNEPQYAHLNQPGAEWWTRTSSELSDDEPTAGSINVVHGTGVVHGGEGQVAGRGGNPACSVIPAICVDPTALPSTVDLSYITEP